MSANPAPEVVAAAQSAEAQWHVPASVTIAQYALESGWGQHMPPGSNNPFGIKAVGGQPAVGVATKEFAHGHMITEEQPFAKFSSIAAAFDAHAKLLATHPIYAPAVKLLPNVRAFVTEMAKHYATDPNYAAKLMSLINADDLTRYDAP